MSYAHPDEKVYVNGRPVPPSDVSTCPRCGLPRLYHSSRKRNTLCVDCRAVENPSREMLRELHRVPDPIEEPGKFVRRGLIWHWEPAPAPMSAADRAWCEKAAGEHFWHRWERANRRDVNPLQAEAEVRARKIRTTQTPTTKEGLAA